MSFRVDRLLTLCFFGPLCRLLRPKGLRIPILMYHSISEERETGHPYYWINTSPDIFAEQMKCLHDNDYQVISLSDAVELIKNHDCVSGSPAADPTEHESRQPSPLRPVVLTFDDAYLDFYTHAFPVLRRYGFTATLFLPTAYVDGRRPGIRGREHLTWEQAHELWSDTITFGSHTVNHLQLFGAKSSGDRIRTSEIKRNHRSPP